MTARANVLTVGIIASLVLSTFNSRAGSVEIYPAPAGEECSKQFVVEVDGKAVPVYSAKVASGTPERRWKAMDDKAHSADYFETASFAYFDLRDSATVTVSCPEPIRSAKVLPSSAQIQPTIRGKTITFQITRPSALTIEISDDWVHSLHLFANPPEENAPRGNAPNVIFFGPGIHEITHLEVTNNQTVYIAGGAIVRAVIGPEEPFQISSYSGLKTYEPTFVLRGTNITFRGRGILDGSRAQHMRATWWLCTVRTFAWKASSCAIRAPGMFRFGVQRGSTSGT